MSADDTVLKILRAKVDFVYLLKFLNFRFRSWTEGGRVRTHHGKLVIRRAQVIVQQLVKKNDFAFEASIGSSAKRLEILNDNELRHECCSCRHVVRNFRFGFPYRVSLHPTASAGFLNFSIPSDSGGPRKG